jgi:DNA topoisomerase IB
MMLQLELLEELQQELEEWELLLEMTQKEQQICSFAKALKNLQIQRSLHF